MEATSSKLDSSASVVVELNEDEARRRLKEADELKTEGNDHFRAKRWEDALGVYRSALGRVPKRKEPKGKPDMKEKDKEGGDVEDEIEEESNPQDAAAASEEQANEEPLTELEVECAQVRSILNANIGACYVKLGEHKETVAACTQALIDNPQYIKALQRRAGSNEKLNTWSSLTSAQEDYTSLLKLLPPSSSEIVETKRALASLKPRLEAAQKNETAEMIDKLKGLGNSILGNFGMSTDNFQFVPNGQGGYSMNFVR